VPSKTDLEMDLLDGDFGASLSAAAVNGPGSVLSFDGQLPIRAWALQLSSNGTITTATVAVEGSLDGSTWFPVSVTKADTGAATANVNYAAGGAALYFASAAGTALRYLRANLSALTGGGSVTANMLIVGG